jgi:hypothetical protein
MKQLFLFDEPIKQQKAPQKKQGRPHTLTPKKVFDVLESIKGKKSNSSIIRKYNLSERTFFRIKKGEYDHLLKKYLDQHLENFSLDFYS